MVVNNSRGPNITMILAIKCYVIVHSKAIVGVGVNAGVFKQFLIALRRILGTDEEFYLVMDNLRLYHALNTFYNSYPYNKNFLSWYSPFLNPCEEIFSF